MNLITAQCQSPQKYWNRVKGFTATTADIAAFFILSSLNKRYHTNISGIPIVQASINYICNNGLIAKASKSTVGRHIKLLEKIGFIKVNRDKWNIKGRDINSYSLNLDFFVDADSLSLATFRDLLTVKLASKLTVKINTTLTLFLQSKSKSGIDYKKEEETEIALEGISVSSFLPGKVHRGNNKFKSPKQTHLQRTMAKLEEWGNKKKLWKLGIKGIEAMIMEAERLDAEESREEGVKEENAKEKENGYQPTTSACNNAFQQKRDPKEMETRRQAVNRNETKINTEWNEGCSEAREEMRRDEIDRNTREKEEYNKLLIREDMLWQRKVRLSAEEVGEYQKFALRKHKFYETGEIPEEKEEEEKEKGIVSREELVSKTREAAVNRRAEKSREEESVEERIREGIEERAKYLRERKEACYSSAIKESGEGRKEAEERKARLKAAMKLEKTNANI